MNEYNDLFKNIMKTALIASLVETHRIDTQKFAAEMFDGTNARREYLECHENIKTNITDKDMLLLQIDSALDIGDMELFIQLTNELKELEQSV